ncbi:MAG TPA: tRNA (adenosine(37)-N6)-dimethylallyltransferase MiaA [Desulfurivibrio alkaliphilus]|uniref:tRNA dimethylallyltransferase n=1 Tax=Desulfurivibrio alkaliphilus TaxID=427923 RepID=A0A7C2XGE3_9BACT|nr:tRNA (adenosine(37)-N6)-dimethylallyltransferase MiaA [Desulfurivibrio alkaliphilus]
MKSSHIYRKKEAGTTDFCLVGPTAVGKTALALELARRFDAEIISVDSMQVYRYLDIGTAKATIAERRQVPHHLIDIIDPDQDYNLARFLADAAAARREIKARGKGVLFTGGTGLYLKGLLDGIFEFNCEDKLLRTELNAWLEREGAGALHAELARVDPQSAGRIHPHDHQRLLRALEIYLTGGVPWSELLRRSRQTALLNPGVPLIGLARPRDILYERINHRVKIMLDQGLAAEVRELLDRGYGPELPAMQAIGYRHMVQYLQGDWSLKQAEELLARDTRRYAKRQLTWFNGMERIKWFSPENPDGICRWLEQHSP